MLTSVTNSELTNNNNPLGNDSLLCQENQQNNNDSTMLTQPIEKKPRQHGSRPTKIQQSVPSFKPIPQQALPNAIPPE